MRNTRKRSRVTPEIDLVSGPAPTPPLETCSEIHIDHPTNGSIHMSAFVYNASTAWEQAHKSDQNMTKLEAFEIRGTWDEQGNAWLDGKRAPEFDLANDEMDADPNGWERFWC